MKLILNKILSCFLLLTGSLPVLFTLFFIIKQQVIRQMMLEKFEQQQMHTITLPAGEVQWVKQRKEIWFQGKMFDVKTVTEKKGQFTFTGLFDEEETALNKYLVKDFNQKNESGNRLLTQLFQWLQAVYPATTGDILSSPAFKNWETCFYQFQIPLTYKKILIPPPRFDYRYN